MVESHHGFRKAVRAFLSKYQVHASLNAWKAQYRCPYSTTDQLRLKEAMIHLRDTLGATDPEAQAIGSYLMQARYYECGLLQIATGPNPKNFYAHNPIGTAEIFVDKQFVEWRYFKEVLALILYAESTHFLNASGQPDICFDESACQLRLDAFRQRHNMENYIPEMIHGLPEGITEKQQQ